MLHSLLRVVGVSSLLIAAPLSAASAADMPLKAPPPPPAPMWTGWYIGANVGGSFGRTRESASYPPTILPTSQFGSISSDLDGVIGGGQIGYNWQTGNWVLGIEADIQGSGERSSNTLYGTATTTIPGAGLFTLPGTLTTTEKLDWFGTVRGRAGMTIGPNWLLYGTGGLAYGGLKTSDTLTTTTTAGAPLIAANSFDTTRAGWTVGAGVEGWLGRDWTAKLEYLYVDLGSFSNTFTGAGLFTPIAQSIHVTDNIVRVGLNYHFK
jgi:outer membrane immunogenic protein